MPQPFGVELMRIARNVVRLQNRQRRLRRDLKATMKDLRLERRHMKALAAQDRDPAVVPSRLFGDGVGMTVPLERPEKPPLLEQEPLV